MATTKDFQIDRRVRIAMDALSGSQRAILTPVLETKEGFVAHAELPGATKKLSTATPLYLMRVGGGMRVIFTMQGENIVVQDIMRTATMKYFTPKRAKKSQKTRKENGGYSVKRGEAAKVHKV
jgi:hypothetical protein